MVPAGPLSQSHEEAGAGSGHGINSHAGGKLVQEQEAKGQSGGR